MAKRELFMRAGRYSCAPKDIGMWEQGNKVNWAATKWLGHLMPAAPLMRFNEHTLQYGR